MTGKSSTRTMCVTPKLYQMTGSASSRLWSCRTAVVAAAGMHEPLSGTQHVGLRSRTPCSLQWLSQVGPKPGWWQTEGCVKQLAAAVCDMQAGGTGKGRPGRQETRTRVRRSTNKFSLALFTGALVEHAPTPHSLQHNYAIKKDVATTPFQ